MYTVSILSRTNRQWRSIQVASLSEAVQLTLGLETEWTVEHGMLATGKHPLTKGPMLTRKYAHTVRSLVSRWKAKYFEPVACFRFSDSQLLTWHKHLAYHL